MSKRSSHKKINRHLIISLVIFLLIIAIINHRYSKKHPPILPHPQLYGLLDSLQYMLPRADTILQTIHHFSFSLGYSEAAEQPAWVAYRLTDDMLKGSLERKDNFRDDPSVSSGSASLRDYEKSGYHRGHMAPAADMSWHETALDESFYLSNVCPQEGSFNSGIWLRLEEQVRIWAHENKQLIIVAGPVLDKNLKHIGPNKVAVPRYFYKIILDSSPPESRGIAFVMKNRSSSKPLRDYAVTIDSVEHLTNIDFFYQLPDSLENLLEGDLYYQAWGL